MNAYLAAILLGVLALTPCAYAAENPPLCGDLNDTGNVTSSDALTLLRFAVGQPVDLTCPDYLQRYGFDVDRGHSALWSFGFLFGVRVHVATSVTVTHLGMFSRDASDHVKMALYSDSGGEPANLLASTTAAELAIGSNEILVTESAPISPGFYWIMAVMDATTSIASNDEATVDNIAKYRVFDFANPLPASFGLASTDTGSTMDFWMKVLQ